MLLKRNGERGRKKNCSLQQFVGKTVWKMYIIKTTPFIHTDFKHILFLNEKKSAKQKKKKNENYYCGKIGKKKKTESFKPASKLF